MWNKSRLFILSAPAGTGKTTLIERLVQEVPNVVQAISFTTRLPRKGEINGVHYHFIDKKSFEERIRHGDFLEYVSLYGDYYGTSRSAVDIELAAGLIVFLVIDTQGALKLKGKVDATFIFLSPPSLEILRHRLEQRRTETKEKIEQRLKVAVEEMQKRDLYDVEIVNDNLDEALSKLKHTVLS